jgi:hypothetical protein
MKQYFVTMTELALDPFVADDEAITRVHRLSTETIGRLREKLPTAELEEVAGKDWMSCETCWDPGSDPAPFDAEDRRSGA